MKTKAVRSQAKQKRPPTRKSAGATAAQRATAPAVSPAPTPAPRVRTDCDFLRPIA